MFSHRPSINVGKKIKERNKWINERKNQHESRQRTERRRARTDKRTKGYIIIYFPDGFIQTDLPSMNKFLPLVMFGDCFCLLIAWWLFGWQRHVVENVKELYHASLLTHDLFTWFDDFITTFRLTPTHNSRLIRKETHTQRPVVSTWNSATYEAIKHVPHTCRLVMYR